MKLSIITVNLNNRDGLQRTIDSVISQTFRDFEWIVIDGGSTDGSKELIEQYAEHFSYWVSEPDKGIYNAMNKGIKVAKGEYLQFLNSGDWLFYDDVLEKVFRYELTEDFIYCNDGGSTGVVENGGSPAIIDFKFLYTYTICHQTIFHKRSLFDNGLFDEKYRIVADWKFLFQHIIKDNATYRKIEILLCVLQEGTSYDNSLTEIERNNVIDELYSPLERFFIESHLDYPKTLHYELLSYIESHMMVKGWFRRLIIIHKHFLGKNACNKYYNFAR